MSTETSPSPSSNLSRESFRKRAAVLTVVGGILGLAIKFAAFQLTGSQAVLSDALESIVNVVSAFTLWYVIIIAAKPADDDHPYGHGKAEYFSAAFEGGLIFFAAGLIIVESIGFLIRPHALNNLDRGQAIIFASVVLNFLLGMYLIRAGRKHHSVSLSASGRHLLADVWTSLGVIAALLLVQWTGFLWIDPVVALITAVYLGWSGFNIILQSTHGLMDAEDLQVLEEVKKLFLKLWKPGIIRIHHTRVMRSGNYHHIDSHVVVPEFWDVKKAHEHTHDFEMEFFNEYPHEGELHFHVDPCRQAYCRVCDLPNCPIRLQKFEEKIPFTIQELRSPYEPEEFLKARS